MEYEDDPHRRRVFFTPPPINHSLVSVEPEPVTPPCGPLQTELACHNWSVSRIFRLLLDRVRVAHHSLSDVSAQCQWFTGAYFERWVFSLLAVEVSL